MITATLNMTQVIVMDSSADFDSVKAWLDAVPPGVLASHGITSYSSVLGQRQISLVCEQKISFIDVDTLILLVAP